MRWDLLPRNVATLVSTPRVQRAEIKPYDVQEARRLLQAAAGDRWEAIYTVAIACGLREGEVLGLTWEDVDLENTRIHVRRQLQRLADRKLALVELKTEDSRRIVDLPAVCISALATHAERQQSERDLAGSRWVETGLVFTTRIGTGIDQRNLLKHYAKLMQTAGLRRIRFHDLRHTAASLLLAQGISFQAVQRTLGHSDIRTTLNVYGHMYADSRRAVAAAMESMLGPVAPAVAPEKKRARVQ